MENSDYLNLSVMDRIREQYEVMSVGYRRIADYITAHTDEVAAMTAAELADSVHASESSVNRFARMLGYERFSELRNVLDAWARGLRNPIDYIDRAYSETGNDGVVEEVFRMDIRNIERTMKRLDKNAFDSAVSLIDEASTVYIVGIRTCAPVASLFAFYLRMVRDRVVLLQSTDISEIFEQMIRIGPDDVLVGISFPRYSMRTLKAMQMANDHSARVISITDIDRSPMNLYSSVNLYASSGMNSITDSLSAAVTLINALIVSICGRHTAELKEHIGELEEAWNNYQTYLGDEMSYIDDARFDREGDAE